MYKVMVCCWALNLCTMLAFQPHKPHNTLLMWLMKLGSLALCTGWQLQYAGLHDM
jgi:hypothetical protein